jgi:hypothetical protein
VTQVGLADAVALGTAGALWLTSYPPDADPGTAAGAAREVSIAGVSLGPPLRLPAGYLVDQATNRGLLLAPVAPRPGAMACQLRDPAAPQASRTFDAVIAVSTTQIAWAPPCAARCGVLVLNLATGRQVTAELTEGRSVARAPGRQREVGPRADATSRESGRRAEPGYAIGPVTVMQSEALGRFACDEVSAS